jgi:phosphatidylserine synthase
MIAATVHAIGFPIISVRFSVLWLLLMVGLGVLMSSTVRHFAFKNIRWNRRQSSRAFVLIALAIGSIVLYSHLALLLIASAYCVHGIVLELVRLVRHRLTSRLA